MDFFFLSKAQIGSISNLEQHDDRSGEPRFDDGEYPECVDVVKDYG